jgi:Ser/Thr protein kinase RdoA (MazF antagonist)
MGGPSTPERADERENRAFPTRFGLVKPCAQLTRPGRLRRLREFAVNALAQYDVQVAGCVLVSTDTNLIYRIRDAGNRVYALRIAAANWRTADDLRSETMWLEALVRDTDIRVPRVVRATDGSRFVRARARGIPGERLALLTSWHPGRLLDGHLSEATVTAVGELFARLHLHGSAWSPPPGFTERVFDRVFSRGEPALLFAPEQRDAYDVRSHRIVRQAWERADDAYADLPAADRRVIHCDLWHGNIKAHRGELYPFDFEDTVLGYRLHDLAMALLDLAEDGGIDRYERLLPAMRRGYERHLPWPEGDMIALQTGRMVWRLNWTARHQRERFAVEVAFFADLVERTRRLGRLTEPLRLR